MGSVNNLLFHIDGNFRVARLVRDKKTKELAAVKYIERGKKIDENVQREIINHRSLRHPNIIKFKERKIQGTHQSAGGDMKSTARMTEDLEMKLLMSSPMYGTPVKAEKHHGENNRSLFLPCLLLAKTQYPRWKMEEKPN
ncbi:hypothetical protein K1719_023877 [Acacia pycnantha]|nr:hypothetical protein K1719_023877 [Acacia pycnantha]